MPSWVQDDMQTSLCLTVFGTHVYGFPICTIKLSFFFPVLSHVNLILRPARRTLWGRGNYLLCKRRTGICGALMAGAPPLSPGACCPSCLQHCPPGRGSRGEGSRGRVQFWSHIKSLPPWDIRLRDLWLKREVGGQTPVKKTHTSPTWCHFWQAKPPNQGLILKLNYSFNLPQKHSHSWSGIFWSASLISCHVCLLHLPSKKIYDPCFSSERTGPFLTQTLMSSFDNNYPPHHSILYISEHLYLLEGMLPKSFNETNLISIFTWFEFCVLTHQRKVRRQEGKGAGICWSVQNLASGIQLPGFHF